jgi:hypothetical protein
MPMILRCTAKALQLVGPTRLALPPPPADDADWYLNVLWIDRRKCLLLTHAGTLFPVFVPNVHAADLRPLGRWLVTTVEAESRQEGLSSECFGVLDADDLQVAKTASRSVLGVMNDVAFQVRYAVAADGGLAHIDATQLNHELRRALHSVGGEYVTSIELLTK